MKTLSIYIGIIGMLLLAVLPARAASEAEFRKLSKTYTLRADGSQEMRVQKELTPVHPCRHERPVRRNIYRV